MERQQNRCRDSHFDPEFGCFGVLSGVFSFAHGGCVLCLPMALKGRFCTWVVIWIRFVLRSFRFVILSGAGNLRGPGGLACWIDR